MSEGSSHMRKCKGYFDVLVKYLDSRLLIKIREICRVPSFGQDVIELT